MSLRVPPIFERFPALRHRLSHHPLGEFPTPVQQLKGFGHDALYIKRDDLSGTVYGGNKIRKLEFLLAESMKKGASGVQTAGGLGSNHVVATSVYSRQLGLRCQAVLLPQPKSRNLRKNLLWTLSTGTQVNFCSDPKTFWQAQTDMAQNYRTQWGDYPSMILMGGSSPLGNVGFVDGAFELASQIRNGDLPKPDLIYLPMGTMGTSIGLALGFALLGLKIKVVPIRVVSATLGQESRWTAAYRETNMFLNALDDTVPIVPFEGAVGIRHDFLGPGYGHFTEQANTAIRFFESQTKMKLEGTYTGKTMAALLQDLKTGSLDGKTILYWSTYNSCPGPAHLDDLEVPDGLVDWINPPFQPLDLA